MSWQILLARARLPLVVAALLFLAFGGLPGVGWLPRLIGVGVVNFAVLSTGTVKRQALEVEPPVRARWRGMNSPASRVPSHRVHTYGQTYAIDLAYEPHEGARPMSPHWWPLSLPPVNYAGFGQPVHAATSGAVVSVHNKQRDHRSRTSFLSLPYMIVEGLLRELLGPARLLGNHVIIDDGSGHYALYAHLKQGSVQVSEGQHVEAGQPIAECGNSGNTSEPHLHFQIMDQANPIVAAGLPMTFTGISLDEQPRMGLPANDEVMEVDRDLLSGG